MNLRDMEERFKKRLKEGIPKKGVDEKAIDIEKQLKKGVQQGRYPELKDIGADLKSVAYTLANTESEAAFVEEVKRKGRQFKNYPTFGKRLEKTRMKMSFLRRSGKEKEKGFLSLPVKEKMELLKKLTKYPEWYLDRATLDLGSHFEAISPPGVSQVEERRQYRLIAKLLYDFDLFKQSFTKAEEEHEEELIAYERVVKRAESILAKAWKERIQGEKERLHKSHSTPSINKIKSIL